jgi:hypothetical protein
MSKEITFLIIFAVIITIFIISVFGGLLYVSIL